MSSSGEKSTAQAQSKQADMANSSGLVVTTKDVAIKAQERTPLPGLKAKPTVAGPKNGSGQKRSIHATMARAGYFCIPRAAMKKVIQEIIANVTPGNVEYRIQAQALEALHEVAELHLERILELAAETAQKDCRATLMAKDFSTARKLLRNAMMDPERS